MHFSIFRNCQIYRGDPVLIKIRIFKSDTSLCIAKLLDIVSIIVKFPTNSTIHITFVHSKHGSFFSMILGVILKQIFFFKNAYFLACPENHLRSLVNIGKRLAPQG